MELEAAIARFEANKRQSALLRLPAEVRNVIYEYLAEESETTITVDRGIILASTPACVCRQLRAEFLPFVAGKDKTLHTTVTNFDFKHVNKASPNIKRLHGATSQMLNTTSAIELYFTMRITDYRTPKHSDESSMWMWIEAAVPVNTHHKVAAMSAKGVELNLDQAANLYTWHFEQILDNREYYSYEGGVIMARELVAIQRATWGFLFQQGILSVRHWDVTE
jgi:hypothetical protein